MGLISTVPQRPDARAAGRGVVAAVVVFGALLWSPVAALAAHRPPPPAGVPQLAPGQLPHACTTSEYNSSAFDGAYYEIALNSWVTAPNCYQVWGNLEASPSQLAVAGQPVTVAAIPNQGSNSATYAPQTKSITWVAGGKVVSGCGATDLTCTLIPAAAATDAWQWVQVEVSMPRTFFIDSPGSNCAGQHLCAGFETHAWTFIGVPPRCNTRRHAVTGTAADAGSPTPPAAARDAASPIATVATSPRDSPALYYCEGLIKYSAAGTGISFAGLAAVLAFLPDPTPIKIPELVTATASTYVAGFFGSVSAAAAMAQSDPPRADYKVIARPRVPHIARIKASAAVPAQTALALNAVQSGALKATALAVATTDSIARAGGAKLAHNSVWQHRQIKAVIKYAKQLSAAIDALVPVSTHAAALVSQSPVLSKPFDKSRLPALKHRLAQHGLPPSLAKLIRSFHIPGTTPHSVSAAIQKLSASALPTSLPALLGGAATVQLYQQAASLLRAFAATQ